MYFTLEEFTRSSVAQKNRIDNTPDEEALKNLQYLMSVLEQVRAGFGSPIIITSGYRCKPLNDLVGGSKTSAHLKGLAADLVCNNNRKLFEFIRDNFSFDQLINEKNYSWVHFGLSRGQNRHMCFSR